MAYYEKVGLLSLNSDSSKFLVCEPGGGYGHDVNDVAAQKMKKVYIMPGGRYEKGESDEECLKREILEELGTSITNDGLEFIGEYVDVAASHPDRDVSIRLYKGSLVGEVRLKAEIGAVHWIGREDVGNELVSGIIRNKIIPDLVARGLLV